MYSLASAEVLMSICSSTIYTNIFHDKLNADNDIDICTV